MNKKARVLIVKSRKVREREREETCTVSVDNKEICLAAFTPPMRYKKR